MRHALVGADVFDGEARRTGDAVVLDGALIADVVPVTALAPDVARTELPGGLIAPGFVDLQVNGGGGVLFNCAPTVAGVRAICAAHRPFGSTAILPTVITDRPEVTFAAIEAVAAAMAEGVPGCAGVHVEGPFIALARKGAHDPALIRTMTDDDLARLAATTVRPLLLTVATESVTPDQIGRLADAGILVSLGHTDAPFADACAAFDAGARSATHLFNAMSPFGSREPGLVGAVLSRGDVWCGIIADGHHAHLASLAIAVRAKAGPARLVAITDAMPTVGSAEDVFHLNGRKVTRRNGRLTLDDGTLAGSDLTMIGSVRTLAGPLDLGLDEALRMASLYPAQCFGDDTRGRVAAGLRADLVHLTEGLEVTGTWIGGVYSSANQPNQAFLSPSWSIS